jgi:hypothetical protein
MSRGFLYDGFEEGFQRRQCRCGFQSNPVATR